MEIFLKTNADELYKLTDELKEVLKKINEFELKILSVDQPAPELNPET